MPLKELLKHIDELQAQIQAHGKLDSEVLKRINYKFRLDWNYNSNVMEGNSLTKRETRTVMINNITVEGKPLKDVLEMRGHDEIISSILKIGKGELNLSEKRLLEIHKGIMYEDDPEKKKDIGVWKKHNNYLYNYKKERVDFTSFTEVKEKMHELINWLNTQKEKINAKDKKAIHPVVLAFEFHLRYVSIHPFYDGNGRTARIFTNLILIAYGYPPVIVKLEEKEKYYQYLGDIQSYGGSPDLFYEFMGGLLVHSQELVMKAIDGEDIEEPDDFDKKISLFTKKIEEHDDIVKVKKSKKIQKELYFKVFEPFLSRLNLKFEKLNHLFFSNYYCHSNNVREILLLTRYPGESNLQEELSKNLSDTDFKRYAIIHVFREFKRASKQFDVCTFVLITMDTFKYKIEITIGNHDDIEPRLRLMKRMNNEKPPINYVLLDDYFHNIPSKPHIEKLADQVVEDTFEYIEEQNSNKKI